MEDKIMDGLETVKQNQERMGLDISKIKEAVYNPDKGLYARLRIVEEQRKNTSKFFWILMSSGVAVAAAATVAYLSN